MNEYYVYAYLRKKDGTPYYIGKGKGKRAYNLHGNHIMVPPKDRIIFLETDLSENEAFIKESEYISKYGRKDLGTGTLRNLSNGGEGNSGHKHSLETRKKLSNILYEQWSDGRRTMSEEHKVTLSKIHLGKNVSEETREKLRKANIGKKLSEETKKKIGIKSKNKIPWIKGKNHSEESKNKMAEKSSIWSQNQPIVKCPHCSFQKKNSGTMQRYHFNNCKYKNTSSLFI
jgi:hypothetical protein